MVCSKCRKDKPVTEFHRRGDGFQRYCKPCRKEIDSKFYLKYKGKVVARNQRRRTEQRDTIRKLKDGPCMDCGGQFHPAAMHFDHLPEYEKSFSIAIGLQHGYPMELILEEVKKCDLVCANCHAVRTVKRRGDDGV